LLKPVFLDGFFYSGKPIPKSFVYIRFYIIEYFKMRMVMKSILGVLFCLLLSPCMVKAQLSTTSPIKTTAPANPVNWQFSIKKLDNGDYRLEAKAALSQGYHIWAQDPGGDGTLIPTSFTAEQIQNGKWMGDWKEEQTPTVQKIAYVDGAVRYHERTVTFFRDFKAKKGDKIKGAVQYQSCNEKMCFPPAIENFAIVVE
jgi:hypothetical protein